MFLASCDLMATPVTAVNRGASFGPRIVSAGFELTSWRGDPRLHINAVGELDGNEYQDEFAVRRRVARAIVPALKRAGAALLAGQTRPEVERSRFSKGGPGWYTAAMVHVETYEGFERRVLVQQDFRVDTDGEQIALPDRVVTRIGERLKRLSSELHAAIDLPANRRIFGAN